MADPIELPPEVADALQEHEETQPDHLAMLAIALAGKRKEAMTARTNSGIEDVWLKAEEAYLGMDDGNRSSFGSAKWAKPTTPQGPVTTAGSVRESDVKSTAFVRMTSRYVDAGAAKLCEILLPADDKAFSFSSTPAPELIHALKDYSQAVHNGQPLTRAAPAAASATPGVPAVPQGGVPPAPIAGAPPAAPGSSSSGVPITVADVAQETIDIAQAAAKKAETRVYGWMVKSRYRAENRKVIFDGARIGVGVLKGPFPRSVVSRAFDKDKKALTISYKVQPAYEWKDPWNIYPDPACGENIRDGDFLFEKDQFSARQLRKLKNDPGYIAAAIDKVLAAGPTPLASDQRNPGEKPNEHQYTVWHYQGTIKKAEMVAAGGVAPADKKDTDDVYALCTMVNDTVIRAVMNPIDSGELPYHSFPWSRRPGHWAGVGIAEQIEMPQRAINATIRAMFNNAGKAAGSIIVVDRGSVVPADGSWVITPDKIFYMNPDATPDDVRKAFAFFQVPNMTPQLMSILQLCMKLAEEVTNIPLVTQGQSGSTTPETYGATQLQNNNANQLLRSIGNSYDDFITEPVVNLSYEYLLIDPSIPEDEKGDWYIDAHGSAAMVERAISDQVIQQMGQWVMADARVLGVNPRRWFAQFAKSKHLNPTEFQNTPAEQAQIDASPPPAAPAVQVAQIKSQDAQAERTTEQQIASQTQALQKALDDAQNANKLQIAEMRKEVDQLRIEKDRDRDTQYVQAQTERDRANAAAKNLEINTTRELALLQYANQNKMKLADVQAELAQTAAKLATQKELAMNDHVVNLHMHHNPPPVVEPPVQVPGKAPPGRAFEQV